MINSWCAELCKTIIALKTCWVQEVPYPHAGDESKEKNSKDEPQNKRNNGHTPPDSSRIKPQRANYRKILPMDSNNESYLKVLNNLDADYLPPNLRHVSKSSWGCLLTSHLSTFGSSIIVGFDNLAVNQVLFCGIFCKHF